MSLERVVRLVARFREEVAAHRAAGPRAGWELDGALGVELLESMLLARELDVAAHELRARGHGYYTICSSGHEANVVLGRLTGPDDPAIVHYRSAALQVERARWVGDVDPVRDIALSLVASAEEPVSGGRHKVFGGKRLGLIPSTSTIASHLPRAVGIAFGLERAPRLGVAVAGGGHVIAMASFGDASLNHSTALGALNATSWTLHQGLPVPLLFVCEDNGLGISVRTPAGWVETRLRALPHLAYFAAPGWDLAASWRAARAAIEHVRRTRRAAVLHLEAVRLLGHAGSDVDTTYRTPAELEACERRDPVLRAAIDLIDAGAIDAGAVLAMQAAARARVEAAAAWAIERPKLTSRAAVMASLARPIDDARIAAHAAAAGDLGGQPLTLAQGVNAALAEALGRYPEALIFGEDVAKKGGVYGVTKGLFARGGPLRVWNTLLDEQTILGLALGTATVGLLPVPEIQYLAYLHNAEDQLRGEAATMAFFSDGAHDNPMVVRIAGLAYQKGFGGHFHNDNSVAVLRDVPDLVVAVPARGDDAVAIYRSAFALAREARRVVVVIEPIALYHTRDLERDGDGAWAAAPAAGGAAVGRARVYGEDAGDLAIATFGNGVWMCLRVARKVERELRKRVRVLDLRWLAPLPTGDVVAHARACGRLLVVDECRRTGNVSEAIAAAMMDAGTAATVRWARVAAADSFIPLGDAANLVLVDEDEIFAAAARLLA
jgi:2-oxoisovalerate dehydrogenase E1 component